MNKTIRMIFTLAAVILTARLGRINYNDHCETYYNLNMDRIVERADSVYGLSDVYEIREDGVKTYNNFVIVATDWNIYPFGSVVETSRGIGIVLDHIGAVKNRNTVDIATEW